MVKLPLISGTYEFKVLHLFAGIGGGSLGFKNARYAFKGLAGRFRNLVGIDVNASALKDYEHIVGSPTKVMDLFSREQYIAFHGELPPEDWREATPKDILEAAGGKYPDVIFTSPPCKGLSSLLPKSSAESPKYQALNQLVVRGISLTLEAFRENIPALILLENVPRITTRGTVLLDEVKSVLKQYGYVFHPGTYDCGEWGGLGQHRKRYLLIARQAKKLPVFVYKPHKKRVKAIGEVLNKLTLPNDPSMGIMHRLPKLKWKTWVRLALIPPGGDWRDLRKFELEDFISYSPRGRGSYGVQEWDKPGATVIGNSKVNGSNASCVADPRANRHLSHFKVVPFDKPSGTVTGATHIANGAICVADIRLKESGKRHPNVYRIVRWDEPSPCITGTRFGSGALAVADIRLNIGNGFAGSPGLYGVNNWDEPAQTISGSARVTSSNCPAAIADIRVNGNLRAGAYGVQDISKPSVTISGSMDVHQGAAAVADCKIPDYMDSVPIIISPWGFWHRPLTTLELAALQGFPITLDDGSPLALDGKSDAKWREKIGNAVPPPAAEAIAEYMLQSLVANKCGDLLLSFTEVWVDKEDGDFSVQLIHEEVNTNGHVMS